ncbi:hypothetical protein DET49_12011 [Salegentibacter sp. 24]|nr:hypothetical protein DET49_12011 [Salegentibacter sp. 24]
MRLQNGECLSMYGGKLANMYQFRKNIAQKNMIQNKMQKNIEKDIPKGVQKQVQKTPQKGKIN